MIALARLARERLARGGHRRAGRRLADRADRARRQRPRARRGRIACRRAGSTSAPSVRRPCRAGRARLRVVGQRAAVEDATIDRVRRGAARRRARRSDAVLRGLFVTGTDTGVGKTVVVGRADAPLSTARCRSGTGSRFRPASRQDDDTAEVARLGGCAPDEILATGRSARAPRLAASGRAARAARRSTSRPLARSLRRADRSARWIVEGAGGVLVPLNESDAHGRSDGPARAAGPRRRADRRSARSTTRC